MMDYGTLSTVPNGVNYDQYGQSSTTGNNAAQPEVASYDDTIYLNEWNEGVEQSTGTNTATVSTTASTEVCHYVFFSSEDSKKQFEELTIYLFLIPAFFIFLLLCLLKRRKYRWLNFLDGRPGIAVPIYFLESKDRDLLIAGFGLAINLVLLSVLENVPIFRFEYHHSWKPVFALLTALIVGALIWPVLATISSRHPIGYVLGTVYSWALSVALLIPSTPCTGEQVIILIGVVLLHLPMYASLVYLSVRLPWLAFTSYRERKQHGKSLLDPVEEFTGARDHQKRHIRDVFAAARSKWMEKSIKSRVIASIPGFHVSNTVFIAVVMSLLVTYWLTVYLVLQYHDALQNYIIPSILETASSLIEGSLEFVRGFPSETVESWRAVVKEYYDDIYFWKDFVTAAIWVSFVLAGCFNALSLLFSLRRYRRHMLYLYTGQYRSIPRYAVTWSPQGVLVCSISAVSLLPILIFIFYVGTETAHSFPNLMLS